MRRVLSSWSGMRKYLEKEMLAESLQGRIRYCCTTYVGMDGCRIFEVYIDGEQVKRFSWETVNTYFIAQGYKENDTPWGRLEYWSGFWPLLNEHPINSRTEYTDEEFADALEVYRNHDIHESIFSENPLVRMFAVLDRQIGKRTLAKLKDTLCQQPVWLQKFYSARLTAEEIIETEDEEVYEI